MSLNSRLFQVYVEGADVITQLRNLKAAIAAKTGLPVERVALSDAFPCNTWTQWPYTKGILDLAENVKFAKQPCVLPDTFEGKLVYFKDYNEFDKQITDEERKAIRIKENNANNASNSYRRKEKPLRIQMSSVSESDPV
ncbi:ubiquitin carboxyl-terminal hydrolase [Aphelenchoides avenae]|nr:ubiquitin carboxyl-terminal hydrolase [Aphelenchus avenae]